MGILPQQSGQLHRKMSYGSLTKGYYDNKRLLFGKGSGADFIVPPITFALIF